MINLTLNEKDIYKMKLTGARPGAFPGGGTLPGAFPGGGALPPCTCGGGERPCACGG